MRELPFASGVEISYWNFYYYNKGKTMLNTDMGNHVGDWCNSKVVLKSTAAANGAYAYRDTLQADQFMLDHHGKHTNFAAQDASDGWYADYPNVRGELGGSEKGIGVKTNQFIAYVAKGSHELYTTSEDHWSEGYSYIQAMADLCSPAGKCVEIDSSKGRFEIFTWDGADAKVRGLDGQISWANYQGRCGNIAAGASAAGYARQRENGPNGIGPVRSFEYSPENTMRSYGARWTASSTGCESDRNDYSSPAVFFNGAYRLFFKGAAGNTMFQSTSTDLVGWTSQVATGHNCNFTPYAIVYQSRLHLLFQDGNGACVHTSSADGIAWSGEEKIGINIDWQPRATEIFGTLWVAARNHNGNNIMYALYDGTTWKNGDTGYGSRAPPTIVSFKGRLFLYFRDWDYECIRTLLWTGNPVNGSGQWAPSSSKYDTGFNTSDAPCAIVRGNLLYMFYREGGSQHALMRCCSADGETFVPTRTNTRPGGIQFNGWPNASLNARTANIIVMGQDVSGKAHMVCTSNDNVTDYQIDYQAQAQRQTVDDMGWSQDAPHGFMDVIGQGYPGDYVRTVGVDHTVSVALAGSSAQNTSCGDYSYYHTTDDRVICTIAPTASKPRQSQPTGDNVKVNDSFATLRDKGYGDHFRGWTDVQEQGVKNDYARFVGDGEPWLSIAMAGSKEQYSKKGDYVFDSSSGVVTKGCIMQ